MSQKPIWGFGLYDIISDIIRYMKTSKVLAIITITLILAVLILLVLRMPQAATPAANTPHASETSQTQVPTPVASVAYACDAGNSLTAAFFEGTTTTPTNPSLPPVPAGTVTVALSDGRTMTLTQTISADGARYANKDESFVFWGKGNGLIILEEGKAKMFTGCIVVTKDPGTLSKVYQNSKEAFTVRYPEGYTVNQKYAYRALGPGKDIAGISFTIPKSLTVGTNLSEDSKVSIEFLPHSKNTDCNAKLFLDYANRDPQNITDKNTDYSMASSSDAGAGNRYEQSVYALLGTNPCVAVRYFIHYGAIENYTPGDVKEFNKSALIRAFDNIRQSLVVAQ